jgi:hypothetical protein
MSAHGSRVRGIGVVGGLGVVVMAVAGCGGSAGAGATSVVTASAATASGHRSVGAAATVPARPKQGASGCSISVVSGIAAESGSADQGRMAGWALLRAGEWSVPAPSGSWHLTESDAGADTTSPGGGFDASVEAWPSQTPWTMTGLFQRQASAMGLSGISTICHTSAASGPNGTTQGVEFTGVSGSEAVHGIMSLSILTPTVPNDFVGQVHTIITPAAQWSTGAEQTLMLISKRAIETPQAP